MTGTITCAAESSKAFSKLRLSLIDNPGRVAESGEILLQLFGKA